MYFSVLVLLVIALISITFDTRADDFNSRSWLLLNDSVFEGGHAVASTSTNLKQTISALRQAHGAKPQQISGGREQLANVSVLSTDGAPPNTSMQVIRRAKELIGTSYKWGGMSEASGFDCSGLLVYLFRSEAGMELPRTTSLMVLGDFQRVHREELKPGDAVFFDQNGRGNVNHVGLYIGHDQFIHAPRTGKTIRIDSLENQYWSSRFSSARRFDGESSS